MRVLFTGSRNWTGIQAEHRAGQVLAGLGGFLLLMGEPLVIVHGDNPEGLDAIVDRWAIRHRYEPGKNLLRYPANWTLFGKAAGPMRNQEMVNDGADLCLGFPLPGSKGTVDCMRRARLAGILTLTVPWELPDEPEDALPPQLRAA